MKANDKNTTNGLEGNQKGYMSSNGWVITKTEYTGKTTYKDYCPKCGKLKSDHKFLQGCPK